jgi:hypothetical protein
MKTLSVAVTLMLITVVAAFAIEGTPVKNWNVQTFDVATLQKNLATEQGRVVGVRINFRGKDIRHTKPNWFESVVWQPNPEGKGFVQVRVLVAKKDVPAFKSITTKPGGEEMVLYGKVVRDSATSLFFINLIGRNVNVDSAGNGAVTW